MRDSESMEKGLLEKERDEIREGVFGATTFGELVQEVKQLGYITGPMVAVNLSQYFLQIISIMMVGHLGKLPLSSTSIAISFCGVTGFSLLHGMSSALDTLCGQAFGAKQYRKLGIHTATAIFCSSLVCIPLSLILLSMGKILIFMGQDPQISQEAGKFAMWLIPSLFAYGTIQPMIKYFRTQSLILPLLVTACASLCCHVPLCWALVFRTGLGHHGAAVAISVSYWLNVIILVSYMKFSPSCESTRIPISSEIFQGLREYFRFAIPTAAMICLEWWTYEFLILLSGFLPSPELETSVFSVCLSTITTLYTIPEGLGAAASTRVSNELGAGNPRAARFTAGTVMFLAVSEAVIVSSAMFFGRGSFGYIFSNEKEVVDYVTEMAPLVSLAIVPDSVHAVLNGIARGCGWQDLGAFVNLGAYYFIGIPVAAVLGFWLKLRAKGLWIGMLTGSLVHTFMLSVIIIFTDWEKKARITRERIFEGSRPLGDSESTEEKTILS